ncbi:MAG: ATP-binding cassette domain-containing protein [Lachnospira sp.]
MPVIQAYNVNIYNRQHNICHNVNLRVDRGTCHALVGADNEGKTSLLDAIVGLNHFQQGEIYLFEHFTPGSSAQLKNRIGYVPDDLLFSNNLTGAQMLDMTMRIKNVTEWIDYAEMLIDYFEVDPSITLNEMSEDMNKRFYIISSILCEPELLILDEPFNFLSRSGTTKLKDWLCAYVCDGNTVLLTSDNYGSISDICDVVSLMKERTTLSKTYFKNDLLPCKIITTQNINQQSIPDDVVVIEQNPHLCRLRFSGTNDRLKDIIQQLDCSDFTIENVTVDDILNSTYDWMEDEL